MGATVGSGGGGMRLGMISCEPVISKSQSLCQYQIIMEFSQIHSKMKKKKKKP